MTMREIMMEKLAEELFEDYYDDYELEKIAEELADEIAEEVELEKIAEVVADYVLGKYAEDEYGPVMIMNSERIKNAQQLAERLRSVHLVKEAGWGTALTGALKSVVSKVKPWARKVKPWASSNFMKAHQWYSKQPKLTQWVVRTGVDALAFPILSLPFNMVADAVQTGYRAKLEKEYGLR